MTQLDVPLYHCTIVLAITVSTVPLYHCTSHHSFDRTIVPLYHCTSHHSLDRTIVPLYQPTRCTSYTSHTSLLLDQPTQLYQCTVVPAITVLPVYQCTSQYASNSVPAIPVYQWTSQHVSTSVPAIHCTSVPAIHCTSVPANTVLPVYRCTSHHMCIGLQDSPVCQPLPVYMGLQVRPVCQPVPVHPLYHLTKRGGWLVYSANLDLYCFAGSFVGLLFCHT